MESSNYWVNSEDLVQEKEAAIELLYTSRESDLRNAIIDKLSKHELSLKNKMKNLCVCSLSESFDEPLMWSHYSDGMKGICLLFDREKLKESSLVFEKVIYAEAPPKESFFENYIEYKNGKKLDLSKFLLTKHQRWSYEKEHRSICFNPNNTQPEIGVLKAIKNNTLKGIILGSRISSVDKSILITLSKEFGFKLYMAYANTEEYKVDIEKVKIKKPAK